MRGANTDRVIALNKLRLGDCWIDLVRAADFVIVALSLAAVFGGSSILKMMRLVRVFRVARLLKRVRSLNRIMRWPHCSLRVRGEGRRRARERKGIE